MKSIPDKSIDMILCDLPYGTTACKWDTIIPFEPLWEQYERVIKDNGAIVLTASQPFTTSLINSNIENFSHQWVWDKGMSANPLLAKKMPMKNFEDVLVFYFNYNKFDSRRKYFEYVLKFIGKKKSEIIKETNQGLDHCFRTNSVQFSAPTNDNYELLINKYQIDKMQGFKTYEEISDKDRTYNPILEERGKPIRKGFRGRTSKDSFLGEVEIDTISFNNLYYPKAIIKFSNRKEKKYHPTQKPVALFEYLIKTYTNEGDLVLDNCAGSFTTAIAAENTKRNWICIEQLEEYCEIGRRRIEENRKTLQK
jgi:DNA modification methylase